MHRPLGVASYDRRCAHLRHLLCWVRDLQPSPAFPALTAAPAATTSARTSSARARIRCARVVVFTAAFYFDSYNMQPARQRAELPSNLQRWLHLRHRSSAKHLPSQPHSTAFHSHHRPSGIGTTIIMTPGERIKCLLQIQNASAAPAKYRSCPPPPAIRWLPHV